MAKSMESLPSEDDQSIEKIKEDEELDKLAERLLKGETRDKLEKLAASMITDIMKKNWPEGDKQEAIRNVLREAMKDVTEELTRDVRYSR
jgi:uncharacterized membrane-anchored protein YjiN (DUF445 family)